MPPVIVETARAPQRANTESYTQSFQSRRPFFTWWWRAAARGQPETRCSSSRAAFGMELNRDDAWMKEAEDRFLLAFFFSPRIKSVIPCSFKRNIALVKVHLPATLFAHTRTHTPPYCNRANDGRARNPTALLLACTVALWLSGGRTACPWRLNRVQLTTNRHQFLSMELLLLLSFFFLKHLCKLPAFFCLACVLFC